MSEHAPEIPDVNPDPGVATTMGELLSFLDPETFGSANGSSAAPAGDAPEGDGQPAAPAEGAGAAEGEQPAPGAGDEGVGAVPDPADSAARGVIDAADLTDAWGELATKFDEGQTTAIRDTELAEMQTEMAKYFEAIQQHPRALVGQTVPKVFGEGTETLRDSNDAKEWQDAVRSALADELAERTLKREEGLKETYSTVHASIDLFRNNADLIPNTKQFDRELANEFSAMAKGFEIRQDGKLIGYSISVQPIVDRIRTQLQERRTATPPAPAAPAAPSPQALRAAEQPRTPTGQFDGPQAGIPTRAGTSVDGDNAAAQVRAGFASLGVKF